MFDRIIKLQSVATFNSVDHNQILSNIIRLSRWTAARSPSTGLSSAKENAFSRFIHDFKKKKQDLYMARETVFITSGASLHQTQTHHQFGLWPHQTF